MVLLHTIFSLARIHFSSNFVFSRQFPLFFCTFKTMVGGKNQAFASQDSVAREESSDGYSKQRRHKETSLTPNLVNMGEKNQAFASQVSAAREESSDGYSKERKLKETSPAPTLVNVGGKNQAFASRDSFARKESSDGYSKQRKHKETSLSPTLVNVGEKNQAFPSRDSVARKESSVGYSKQRKLKETSLTPTLVNTGEKNQAFASRDSVARKESSDGYSKQRKLKETSLSPTLVNDLSSFSIKDQRSDRGDSGGYQSVSWGEEYMDRKNSPSSVCSGSDPRILQTSKCHGKALEGEVAGSNQDATLDFNQIESRSSQNATPVKLKPTLYSKNREKRELQRSTDGFQFKKLRPGMVLLKKYISLNEQVEILRTCDELGNGPGGFYQPGYRDGGKLRLKMMCMGKNWDPESGYEATHAIDGPKPHNINERFKDLVRRAIQDSHSMLQSEETSIEKILPSMTPDLCIINFYTSSGKLGLHQDKDESQDSIKKGLPVVSFSIGDKADFLYGTERDERKAERITLESGDVLIFGGDSRLIFHGVDCIHPNTSPKLLLNEFKALLPGRLNLTFRKY